MKDLANEQNVPYYNAPKPANLQTAIESIKEKIKTPVSYAYKNVKITDTLTDMTASDIEDGVADGEVSYSIKRESDEQAHEWYGAPSLTFEDGKAVWDLGDMELEEGAEYSASFRVWPNQTAYDILADLKNRVKNYDSDLSESEKKQIIQLEDDSGYVIGYGFKTNVDSDSQVDYTHVIRENISELPDGTTPGATYTETRNGIDYTAVYTNNDDGRTYTKTMTAAGQSQLPVPDLIPLEAKQIPVEKIWNDAADNSLRPEEVKLEIFRDDATEGEKSVGERVLNSSNAWSLQVYIAPGLIDKDGNVLNAGHDYYVKEENLNDAYEMFCDPKHPMVVNGNLQSSSTENTPAKLQAENNLKGSLIVTKTVRKAASDLTPDPETEFTFQFSLKESSAEDASAWSGTAKIVNKDDSYTEVPVTDGTEIRIRSSQTIRIDKMPNGTYYEVKEVRLPDGYTLDELKGSEGTTSDLANLTISGEAKTLTTQNLVFNNMYTAAPVDITIPVHKHVSGEDVPDITGAYTFTLTASEGAPLPRVQSKTNPDADGGKILFGTDDDKITFTKKGEYIYTVTETNTPEKTIPGMTNDPAYQRNIGVVIEDDGKGHLTAKLTMTKSDSDGCESFTNTYLSQDAKVSIPVSKGL